jgi:predicted outer membrane lipoprotein
MTALNWILFGLACCAFGLVLLMALMEMARREDRAARHHEKRMAPWSDVTITRYGAR